MKSAMAQIRNRLEFMQKQGYNIGVEWAAYGRPRCCNARESRTIGPWLPAPQLLDFLDGIEAGIELERERQRMQQTKRGN